MCAVSRATLRRTKPKRFHTFDNRMHLCKQQERGTNEWHAANEETKRVRRWHERANGMASTHNANEMENVLTRSSDAKFALKTNPMCRRATTMNVGHMERIRLHFSSSSLSLHTLFGMGENERARAHGLGRGVGRRRGRAKWKFHVWFHIISFHFEQCESLLLQRR